MEKLIKWIDGRKTYITLIIAAIIYSLKYFGVINEIMYEWLMTMDTLMFAGAVRHALSKIK